MLTESLSKLKSSIKVRCSLLVYMSSGFSLENKYLRGTSDNKTTCLKETNEKLKRIHTN